MILSSSERLLSPLSNHDLDLEYGLRNFRVARRAKIAAHDASESYLTEAKFDSYDPGQPRDRRELPEPESGQRGSGGETRTWKRQGASRSKKRDRVLWTAFKMESKPPRLATGRS